ncbi:MAG: SMC-Scp complex subunit ScpB [Candidatus Moranbacteria bacterium]|nr:SMC-Scp complex subunit ScpB [Candidatus Moranbacteria bacterium]
MQPEKLKSIIESILFVSGEPMKLLRLAKVTDATEAEVEEAVAKLNAEYAQGRGLRIVQIKDTIQLVTNPDNAEFVAELVKSEIQENLSQAALEVLSIVAYRGPITRAEIEAIRGVNCSFTLRALLIRGLIDRIENIKDNRRYIYNISFDFLKKLGVESVEKLPDWEALNKKEDVAAEETLEEITKETPEIV